MDGKKVIAFNPDKTRFGWGWKISEKLFLKKGDHALNITTVEQFTDIDSILLFPEMEFAQAMGEGNKLKNEISSKQCISGYEFEHLAGFNGVTKKNAVSGGHVRAYASNGKVNSTLYTPCSDIKYLVILGNVSDLKIKDSFVRSIYSINGLNVYELDFKGVNETNNIQIAINGTSLDALWLLNFNPAELSNIKTQIVDTPKGYWGEYSFEPTPNSEFILLLKSYSPLFDIKYNDKKFQSFVSNMMLNGFYIKEPKRFDNNVDNNVSIELNYLNVLRDI